MKQSMRKLNSDSQEKRGLRGKGASRSCVAYARRGGGKKRKEFFPPCFKLEQGGLEGKKRYWAYRRLVTEPSKKEWRGEEGREKEKTAKEGRDRGRVAEENHRRRSG